LGYLLDSGYLVVTYAFNNFLAAQQGGVAALTAVDPLGTNGYQTQTVFGSTRTVYHFDGATPPADQGGLSLNTTGLVANNSYSVEMLFESSGVPGDSAGFSTRSAMTVDSSDTVSIYLRHQDQLLESLSG
jgi:hypothetical protein